VADQRQDVAGNLVNEFDPDFIDAVIDIPNPADQAPETGHLFRFGQADRHHELLAGGEGRMRQDPCAAQGKIPGQGLDRIAVAGFVRTATEGDPVFLGNPDFLASFFHGSISHSMSQG